MGYGDLQGITLEKSDQSFAGPRSEEVGFAHDSALEGSGFELSVPLGHLHQTRPLHHRVELYIDTGVAWQDAGGGRRGRCWPWSGSQQSPVAISGSVAKTGSVSPSTPMLL